MSQTRKELHAKLDEIMDGPVGYDKVLLFVLLNHAGQRDKTGAPYLRHVLRVSEKQPHEDQQITAMCHDVVEDTDATLDDLLALGLSQSQVSTVDRLTKREGESYDDRMQRVLNDPVARAIKIEDLLDNSAPWRYKNRHNLTEKDWERFKKYMKALSVLGYQRS